MEIAAIWCTARVGWVSFVYFMKEGSRRPLSTNSERTSTLFSINSGTRTLLDPNKNLVLTFLQSANWRSCSGHTWCPQIFFFLTDESKAYNLSNWITALCSATWKQCVIHIYISNLYQKFIIQNFSWPYKIPRFLIARPSAYVSSHKIDKDANLSEWVKKMWLRININANFTYKLITDCVRLLVCGLLSATMTVAAKTHKKISRGA
jgi:hypothetical protein